MGHSKKHIHVDAVVENDGLTAIAVVQREPEFRPVVARIIRTTGSVEAEMQAVLLAMRVARKARWTNVMFYCDANGVVRMIEGLAECRPVNVQPLREEAQRLMAENPEWEIQWVKRTHNSCAHAMAGQIMRAYKHGREHGRQGIAIEDFKNKPAAWEEEQKAASAWEEQVLEEIADEQMVGS